MEVAFVNERELSFVPDFSFSALELYTNSKNKSSGDRHVSKGDKFTFNTFVIKQIRI